MPDPVTVPAFAALRGRACASLPDLGRPICLLVQPNVTRRRARYCTAKALPNLALLPTAGGRRGFALGRGSLRVPGR
jgi:hypothetical protein